MRRLSIAALILLGCSVLGCSVEPELRPTRVSQHGGDELRVNVGERGGRGSAIVLVDGSPAHSTVIESPKLIRVRLPPLPRSGLVDVEVRYADGTIVLVPEQLDVSPPSFEVRARE